MASLKTQTMCGSITPMAACLRSFWRKVARRKPMDANPMDTPLSRCLTTWDLILLGIGHMAGAGIYVVTGTVVLNIAGPATVISYLLAGLVALLMGFCYAQFSVNLPKAGTCYSYVYLVGGELLAFLAGWNLLLDYTVSLASLGRSLSAYLDGLTNGAIKNTTEHALAIGEGEAAAIRIDLIAPAAIIIISVIICLGPKLTAYINNFMVILNVIVIAAIVIAGMTLGTVDNFTEGPGGFLPYGFSGVVSGMGVVFFAYVGFDAMATASEETKDPSHSLPIAFCIALSIAIFMYCSASFALSLLIPYNEVTADAPFPQAFNQYGVAWTKYIVATGATIGLTCSLLGQAYIMPRGIYALATDGLLFSQLMYVNSWTKTPLIAIVLSTVLSAALALFLPVDELVEMVSIGILFAMSLMIICLIKIHYMSADDCPFELVEYDAATPLRMLSKADDIDERKSILEETLGERLARIGKLRWKVPLLNRWDADTVISVAIAVLSTSLLAVGCTLALTATALEQSRWWAIALLATTGSVFVFCLCTLLLYEHNTSFAKFKVPFFPWSPVVALFFALYMMASLSAITWIRLAVWVTVGLIFYFSYGIRHSVIAQHGSYADLEHREQDGDFKGYIQGDVNKKDEK